MKRIKSLLLSMVMLTSVLPMSGFRTAEQVAPAAKAPAVADVVVSSANKALANGILNEISLNDQDDDQESDPVKPKNVIEALRNAASAARDARKEISWFSGKWYENRAAELEEEAAGYIESAEKTKEAAETEIADYADKAGQALTDTTTAVGNMQEQIEKVPDAAADAKEWEDVAESTWLVPPVAGYAAGEADKAADLAEDAAAQAVLDNAEAVEKAAEANKNYLAAQETYQAAVDSINEDLEKGEISAAKAEQLTEAAKKETEIVYNALVAAEDAAEASRLKAWDELDQASTRLGTAVSNLNKSIEENTKAVLVDTGIAAATGATLAAVKVVEGVAQYNVNQLNKEIENLEAQKKDLDDKIAAAEEVIAAKQLEVDALNADGADYPMAKKALDEAREELAVAQKVQEAADAALILAEQEKVANNTNLTKSINKVKDGSAKSSDVERVTQYLFRNSDLYPYDYSVDPDDETIQKMQSFSENATVKSQGNNVIKVTDNNETYYYQYEIVGEDGNKYLQYSKAEFISFSDDEEFKAHFFDEDQYAESIKVPYSADGTFYSQWVLFGTVTASFDNTPIYAVKGEDGSITYYLHAENEGNLAASVADGDYEIIRNGDKWEVTVPVTILLSGKTSDKTVTLDIADLKVVEADPSTNSKIMDLSWSGAAAEDKAAYLTQATNALTEAKENYQTEKEKYDTAMAPLTKAIQKNKDIVNENKAKVVPIEKELKELDNKLNGDALEQIVVSVITQNADWSTIWSKLTEEGIDAGLINEALKAFEDAQNMGATVNELIDIMKNGSIEDISKASEDLKTLLDSADILSANTKLTLATWAEDQVSVMHTNAVNDLKEAVNKGLEEVEQLAAEAADAGLDATEKLFVFEVAASAEKLAEALEAEAENEYNAAKDAYEKAHDAHELVNQLIESEYGPDTAKLDEAKQAAEDADKALEGAEEALTAVQEEAAAARTSANRARRAANTLRTVRRFFFGF
jgi:hypothetical protein